MPRLVDTDERRQALADAAARVIATSGIAAATMREVASEAGLTTGALTHHFRDKRELLIFTLETSLERRRAAHPRLLSDDPAADLRARLVGVLPTSDVTRLHWTVTIAFSAQASCDDELAAVQRDAYRRFRVDVTTLVERCIAAGLVGADEDARQLAEHLIAVVDGIAIQALFDPASWPPARQRLHLDRSLLSIIPATP
jgi:AcrR family transcriptional regulator